MRLIDADKLLKSIENENHGLSISGAEEKYARFFQVNMQPTVEAIPVEWIEQWLKRLPKHSQPYAYKVWLRNAVRGMVKDWEKENEVN